MPLSPASHAAVHRPLIICTARERENAKRENNPLINNIVSADDSPHIYFASLGQATHQPANRFLNFLTGFQWIAGADAGKNKDVELNEVHTSGAKIYQRVHQEEDRAAVRLTGEVTSPQPGQSTLGWKSWLIMITGLLSTASIARIACSPLWADKNTATTNLTSPVTTLAEPTSSCPVPPCQRNQTTAGDSVSPDANATIGIHEYINAMNQINTFNGTDLNTIATSTQLNSALAYSPPARGYYIPTIIPIIWNHSDIDWRIRNLFDAIFNKADSALDVNDAKTSEERHIKLLFKTIQITQGYINNAPNDPLASGILKAAKKLLPTLWKIAYHVYDEAIVEQFKRHLSSDKETTRAPFITSYNNLPTT